MREGNETESQKRDRERQMRLDKTGLSGCIKSTSVSTAAALDFRPLEQEECEFRGIQG